MDSNYGRGGVTSNEDVLRNFCTNTSEVKANNLSTHYDSNSDEILLRQYGVLIAKRKGDKLMITSKRYSVTTSKVQNELLRIAMEYGLDVQKTNEFAKGGKVEHQKLSASLKSKLKSANNILKRYGGREITEHEAIMWNVYHNATSGFEAGYEAFDVAGAKNYHNATTREYHAIGDNLIVISHAMTGVHYDDYNFRGTKEENENYYLMNYKNKNYAKGGQSHSSGMASLYIADSIILESPGYTKEKLEKYLKNNNIKREIYPHPRFAGVNDIEFIGSKQALIKMIDEFFAGSEDEIIQELYNHIQSNGHSYYKYEEGGDIAQGNYEMILSQAKEVEHHVEELQNILKGEKDIDAWVVAKMENVSSTLSDITHYLDGKTEYAHGGKMSRGGYFGKDALVKDLSEEFASEELLAKFRKKSGIKDTQLTKPNVIAFAYTDYGGDFMDKVAIEYFLENHPKNIVVENTGYNGKNAIVWGKVAMDWVKATEDYIFGYEDFESFYYDKVYKEEEQAFSEYLYQLQRDGYELDYDEVLQWLLENKGGYFSITTQGLDFYDGDLTNELLEEGLIEKSEEYAKGGKMKTTSNISHYKVRDEIFVDYMDAMNYCDEIGISYDEIEKTKEYAKGGNIKSKTNKKMATKKTNDGQTAPQIKRWLFAGSKGGYNYYNIEKRPYKKPVDEEKKGAPVGYRFSKYAEEKGITNNRFRKPTKAEVQQYAGKKKNGKLIMYRETRSNKSDVNPKKKI